MNPNYSASTYGSAPMDPEAAGAAMAVFGVFMFFMLVIFLVFYVYMAVCLMKMAKKTNTENAWLAWIPIANIILMLQIAKKPLWWIILLFIPFVNIVISVLIWMGISKSLGKEEWLGILMIVPVANIVVPGYLAFSKSETPIPNQPEITPQV